MRNKERRAHERKRVMFGAQASIPGKVVKRECVVRNFSDAGAFVEISDVKTLPDDVHLAIAQKGRKYAARVVWSDENMAGLAFQSESPTLAPDLAFEQQLRNSERKMRKLKQRVKELSGEA